LHFGRAAQRLHIAQPPLSQQIKSLEETIGYPLFQRSSRSVKLTPAGAFLLERARRTLANVNEDLEGVRSVARGEVGLLRVGFVGSAMLTLLPETLRRYRSLYPKVQLRLAEFHTSFLMEQLRAGSLDVAVLRDGGVSEDFHIEPLYAEPFIALLPARHHLARRAAVAVEKLRDESFVFFPRIAGDFAWQNAVGIFHRHGFEPRVVQEAPQWLTIARLVRAGIGLSIAPDSVRQIVTSDVVCRRLAGEKTSTTIDLVYRRKETDPLVMGFCEVARKTFTTRSSRRAPER
jgi:DNA-binding transcriptional LysR family regulator